MDYDLYAPGAASDGVPPAGGDTPPGAGDAAETAPGITPAEAEPSPEPELYRLPYPPETPAAPDPWETAETVPDSRKSAETAPDPWEAADAVPDPWETPDAPAPWERTPRRTRRGARVRRVKKRRRLSGLLGFLAGVTVAGLLALGGRYWEQTADGRRDPFEFHYRDGAVSEREYTGISIPTEPPGQGASFVVLREHGDALTIQEVYRQVNPSVVTVLVGLDEDTAAVGTGVIFSSDGYFVTNYHVVEGGTACRAVLDTGYICNAKYVAGDENSDLAVLKMQSEEPLTAAVFGDSDLLTVGDDVFAIGNPLGMEFRGTLTNGIVSAINRDVQVDGKTMTLIQTNAALNSGNSGGPLINGFGQVVGINVVKMSSTRSTVEGLGFAIPSASMERLINDLLTFGKVTPEPVLGVSVSRFGDTLSDGAYGILVQNVDPGSAAEEAGVLPGDYILSANGDAVRTSEDLLHVRRRLRAGDPMTLALWRDGERLDVVLILKLPS